MISAMLDFLTFALCAPYSETTDGGHFDSLLETVAANGRIIFKLFQVRYVICITQWLEQAVTIKLVPVKGSSSHPGLISMKPEF